MSDIQTLITDLKAKSASSDALSRRVDKLTAEVTELAQKGANTIGKKSAPSVGDQVAEAAAIEMFRNRFTDRARVPVSGFRGKSITSASGFNVTRNEGLVSQVSAATRLRDLVPSVRIDTGGVVEFARHASTTGKAASQASEGATKAQVTPVFEPVTSPVATIAAWLPASRQVLSDVPQLRDFIDTFLRDELDAECDRQLLKGSGADGEMRGFMLDAQAYSRTTAGDVACDVVRRAITQLQLARGVPTGLVVNPVGLERLELEKDTTDRYVMAVEATTAGGSPVIWRVPVVTSTSMDENQFLLADFARAARIYDREDVTITVAEQHADFFVKNMVAILAEERLTLATMRGSMLVKGDLLA
jgi:HK97 family phage major capsid protein